MHIVDTLETLKSFKISFHNNITTDKGSSFASDITRTFGFSHMTLDMFYNPISHPNVYIFGYPTCIYTALVNLISLRGHLYFLSKLITSQNVFRRISILLMVTAPTSIDIYVHSNCSEL